MKKFTTKTVFFVTFVLTLTFTAQETAALPTQIGIPDGGIHLFDGNSADVLIYVENAGTYNIFFEYIPLSNFLNSEFALYINGVLQPGGSRIIAPIIWSQGVERFDTDPAGNERLPQPVQVGGTHGSFAYYPDLLLIRRLAFELEAGYNLLTIHNIAGEMTLMEMTAVMSHIVPTYQQYISSLQNVPRPAANIVHEAEHPYRFNSSFVRPLSVSTPDVTPHSNQVMLLNAFGGDSWGMSGQAVTYRIYVPQEGLYNLSFNMRQNISGVSVFRAVLINGIIPFTEMEAYAFPHSRRFTAHTLADAGGEPFYFHLNQGWNEITLVATHEPALGIIDTLEEVRDEIRHLSLTVRRLTGGRTDVNRDWVITDYIPDVAEQFDGWISRLEAATEEVRTLFNSNVSSVAEVDLRHAIRRLTVLRNNPNELPFRMNELFEGMNSAGMMLVTVSTELQQQPLELDTIIIHGADAELPRPAGWWRRFVSAVAQFFASFTNSATRDVTDSPTLEVWVNRSQWHVEALQFLVDTQFTPQSGINVNLVLTTNDNNIILANAGGIAPDVAIGISTGLPYQMAIRNAAVDLTQFPNFQQVASRFTPGAFLPMMYEGGVFGLPETQDFYVLFYRADLFREFEIPVPDTWDDVIAILPDLSRFGANMFIPLSGPLAAKPFMFTSPFLYQFGADFYALDGLSTAINSDAAVRALTLMTDLYTLYSLPLQVANFYNDFRSGTIPIGISNLETYIRLTTAAPELTGLWNIAPHPGVPDADGNVQRWAAGSAQSVMILTQSELQEEAFSFLDWWTSAEVQTMYANQLITIYGPSFIWSSANLEAFGNLPIPARHRDTILYQWQFLKEVPLTPASYIIEREVSNIWNRVVLGGQNLRLATDRAVMTINREMTRRMTQFGYVNSDGTVIRPYNLPTLEEARRLGGSHE